MSAGFVRAARASDASPLASVQVASWQASLAGLVPDEVLASLTSSGAMEQFAERWLEAITRPPSSRHRVQVAVTAPSAAGGGSITGFAAFGPATDEDRWPATDGELYEFHVLPSMTGQGHGGRLLHAVADTLAEDGFSAATTWVLVADASRLTFLEEAGWARDGSTASLDMGVKVPVARLHVGLSPAAA